MFGFVQNMIRAGECGMYQVLIVDDEYVIREGLAEGIDWQKLGFSHPMVAGNGREALELIR